MLFTPLAIPLWHQSILRYLVVIFPVALIGAHALTRWPKLKPLIFGAMAVCQAMLLLTWQLPWTYMTV
jgi:hypothetical protein